ncbi:MAG TPA: diguanylate cyclase [Burkholderiales bacterium]|nr:diguanylate cyclase [Burkholderiales bacterium]
MQQPAKPIAPPAEPRGPAAEKPIVLVIDDSRVIRRAIGKILSPEFTLVEAEDGEIGWERLISDSRVQVAISDVEMPKLDGYSLICRIRASDEQRLRDLPIIVITGAQDDQTRERAFACGATDFIIKPIDGVQLLARARAHARLDQTTRKLSETSKSLEEQTAVDPLTELHSRRYFVQRATQDLAFAKRHGQDLALIRLEFDNFRDIYKRHGDEVCDRIFIWLAGLMRANSRVEDTPARIRGGEFAILAPSSDRREATTLAERLRNAVANAPFNHNGTPIPLSISLGLATLNGDRVDTIDDLMARAEQKLTLAKAGGGNQLNLGYEDEVPAPEEAVFEQPDLETALKLINGGDGGKLLPYLPDLLTRVLPLVELCDQQLELDLALTLNSLKERLGSVK